MITEEELKKMTDEQVRNLLSSGIKAEEYNLVRNYYMKHIGKKKSLFDYD
jgi:hypothetical protein